MNFYELDNEAKKEFLEIALEKEGKISEKTDGMCGEIYIFDRGPSTVPQYVCVKVPKKANVASEKEVNARFINELRNQLKYFHHQYVHWAYDFREVFGIPVALFRYWGCDLKKLIKKSTASEINKLSIFIYLCVGLRHCYAKGLISHQDLKPANIFLKDMREDFSSLPELDIYIFPKVGDFGLANASVDTNHFGGSRPYMAPEQWSEENLSPKTDIYALGVILCELMSNGHHPNGILLNNYWPEPIEGNSKKWTKPDGWKKWSLNGSEVDEAIGSTIDQDILLLIKEMLSSSQECRPSIDLVIEELLKVVNKIDSHSHDNIVLLINHYDSQVSPDDFERQWPSLYSRWQAFEKKFG